MNKQIVYLICIAILFLAERGTCIPRWSWIDCFPQWTSHQENPSAQPRFPSAFECFFFEILKKMTKKEDDKQVDERIINLFEFEGIFWKYSWIIVQDVFFDGV